MNGSPSLPTGRMDTLLNDVRYALRRTLRSPGFTIAAALTLALGIGANTTIFTLVNAILLRPPASVTEPGRLVSLYTSDYSGPPYGTSSLPDYEDFRKQTDVFDGVMAFLPRSATVGAGDALEGVGLEVVSENYFGVLGVRPAHGRFFLPEEGRPGAAQVAVISDGLFRRRFGGNPSVVGTTIPLNDKPFTIIGIAPPGFTGVMRPLMQDVWVPMHAAVAVGQLNADDLTNRGSRSAFTMARLATGVTLEQAQGRMNIVAAQLRTAYPDQWTDLANQGRRITLLPESASRIPPQVRGPALGFVALLMATVGILLLVCCANVASLMLARAAGRAREIGVRISLGATRRRLIQQLLTESTLIAILGGVLGILIAVWATSALLALLPPLPVRIGLDLSVDGRVLAFTTLAALVTGIAFGLAPALRVTRPDIVSVLKSESGSIDLGGRRLTLHNVLVVSQVAMSVILLVAAALFVRALGNAASIDPGFRVEKLLIVDAGPRPGVEYQDPAPLMEQVQERLVALPGVTAASWAGALPLDMEASRRGVRVPGYTPREGEDMEFHFYIVGPRFFETMEIPLAKGRDLTAADRRGSMGVVIVNEAFAQRFWPGADAVGKRLSVRGPDGPFAEVVGVARNGRFLSLAEASPPMMFVPALQEATGSEVIVRTSGDPMPLLPAVQREIEAVAPTWMISSSRTMEQHVATSVLPQRIAGSVLTVFGLVAVLLVSVGVYGVVSYSVATRAREIGVRVALGARPQDARWLVVRQGARLVALGVVIALPVAWGSMRLLSGFLIGASASDPVAFMAAVGILAAVALVATYIPARRASLIDPMVALRTD